MPGIGLQFVLIRFSNYRNAVSYLILLKVLSIELRLYTVLRISKLKEQYYIVIKEFIRCKSLRYFVNDIKLPPFQLNAHFLGEPNLLLKSNINHLQAYRVCSIWNPDGRFWRWRPTDWLLTSMFNTACCQNNILLTISIRHLTLKVRGRLTG